MYDFNQEQDQQTRVAGPIPAGSSVLVRLNIRNPKYPASGLDMVGEAQSGMLYLDAEYEVIFGTYEGLKIWENIFLPSGEQRTSMSDGQRQAANIAGSKLKGILNAARNVMPKDDSPKAKRQRQIQTWLDLHGLEFPVVVGIAKEMKQGKDGRMYWNNTIARIVTPDMKQYGDIMAGSERITDGPVTGTGSGNGNGSGNKSHAYTSVPEYEQPPVDAYETDMPF